MLDLKHPALLALLFAGSAFADPMLESVKACHDLHSSAVPVGCKVMMLEDIPSFVFGINKDTDVEEATISLFAVVRAACAVETVGVVLVAPGAKPVFGLCSPSTGLIFSPADAEPARVE